MNPIMTGIALYLLLGIVLLALFDLKTRRIRTKFVQASNETQLRLAASGNFVGMRASSVLFLGAMWLFWPMVFVGALTDRPDRIGKTSRKENSHGA